MEESSSGGERFGGDDVGRLVCTAGLFFFLCQITLAKTDLQYHKYFRGVLFPAPPQVYTYQTLVDIVVILLFLRYGVFCGDRGDSGGEASATLGWHTARPPKTPQHPKEWRPHCITYL